MRGLGRSVTHDGTTVIVRDGIVIRRAEPKDLVAVLAVFDSTVAWMVSQGNTKQWGSSPWSEQQRMVERFRHHLEQDGSKILRFRGRDADRKTH